MKVLLFNGSPHQKGCTYTALREIETVLQDEGIETEIFHIGTRPLYGCTDCRKCKTDPDHLCVFDDVVNIAKKKVAGADGFVFGAAVHYASVNGTMRTFMDRLFYSGGAFAYKVAAGVASARRAGTSATLDQLGKHFAITNMMTVGSQYWNMVHGMTSEEVLQDLEGLQTMRVLGRNMAWLLKSIEAGRLAGITPPQAEAVRQRTNFIR